MNDIKPTKINELLEERKRLLTEIHKAEKSLSRCTGSNAEDTTMTVRSFDKNSSDDSKIEVSLMIEVLEKQKALYEKELEPTNKIISSIEIMLEAHQ